MGTQKVQIESVVCGPIMCIINLTPVETLKIDLKTYLTYTPAETLEIFDAQHRDQIDGLFSFDFDDTSDHSIVFDSPIPKVVYYNELDPEDQSFLQGTSDFICHEFNKVCVYKFAHGSCFNDSQNCNFREGNEPVCSPVTDAPTDRDYRCFSKAPPAYYQKDSYYPILTSDKTRKFESIGCSRGYDYFNKTGNHLGKICDSIDSDKVGEVPLSICRFSDRDVCPFVKDENGVDILSECLYSYDLHKWYYQSDIAGVLDKTVDGNVTAYNIGACGLPRIDLGKKCDVFLNNCKKEFMCIPRQAHPQKSKIAVGSQVELSDGTFVTVSNLKPGDVLQGNETVTASSLDGEFYNVTIKTNFINEKVCMHPLDVNFCNKSCSTGSECIQFGEEFICVPSVGGLDYIYSSDVNGVYNADTRLYFTYRNDIWIDSMLTFSKVQQDALNNLNLILSDNFTNVWMDTFEDHIFWLVEMEGSNITIWKTGTKKYVNVVDLKNHKLIGAGITNNGDNGAQPYIAYASYEEDDNIWRLSFTTVPKDQNVTLGSSNSKYTPQITPGYNDPNETIDDVISNMRVKFYKYQSVAVVLYRVLANSNKSTIFIIRDFRKGDEREFHYVVNDRWYTDFTLIEDHSLGEYTFNIAGAYSDVIEYHEIKVAKYNQTNLPIFETDNVMGQRPANFYLGSELSKGDVQGINKFVLSDPKLGGDFANGYLAIRFDYLEGKDYLNEINFDISLSNMLYVGQKVFLYFVIEKGDDFPNNEEDFECTVLGGANIDGKFYVVFKDNAVGVNLDQLSKNLNGRNLQKVFLYSSLPETKYNIYQPYDSIQLENIQLTTDDKGEKFTNRFGIYDFYSTISARFYDIYDNELILVSSKYQAIHESQTPLPSNYEGEYYHALAKRYFDKRYNFSINGKRIFDHGSFSSAPVSVKLGEYISNQAPETPITNPGSLAEIGVTITGAFVTKFNTPFGQRALYTVGKMSPSDSTSQDKPAIILPAYAYRKIKKVQIQFDHTDQDLNIPDPDGKRQISNILSRGNNFYIIYDVPKSVDETITSDATLMYYPLNIDTQNIESLDARKGIYYPFKYVSNHKRWDGWAINQDGEILTVGNLKSK
jgi:hypothetical protein